MNWTEGNLARHSRGKTKNEVLKRQKQHFAKARTRLLSGNTRNSPVAISFLNLEHKRPRYTSKESSPSLRMASSKIPAQSYKELTISMPKESGVIERGKYCEWDGYHTNSKKRSLLAAIVSEENAQEKRRRVLSQPDWAGLQMQQPIDIVFQGQIQASSGRLWQKTDSCKQTSNIKSRRRIHGPQIGVSHRSRQDDLEIPKRSPGLYPIRVTVGSQSTTGTENSDLLKDPDMPMLKAYRTSKLPPTKIPSSCSSKHNEMSNTHLHLRKDYKIDMHNHSYHRLSKSGADAQDGTQQRPFTQDNPGHIVYASSDILEPIPRRPEISIILERSSPAKSTGSGSMHAEVGKPKRQAPSEVADNELWMKRLIPEDSLTSPLTRSSSLLEGPIPQPSISPGISGMYSQVGSDTIEPPEASSLGTLSSLTGRPTNSHENYHRRTSSHQVDEPCPKNCQTQGVQVLQEASKPKRCDSANRNSDCIEPHVLLPKCVKTPDETIKPSVEFHVSRNDSHQIYKQQSSIPMGDGNIEWMNFVLGDDSDEFANKAFQEAARDAANHLKPSQSSGSSYELPITDIRIQDTAKTCDQIPATMATKATNGDCNTASSDLASTSVLATNGSDVPLQIRSRDSQLWLSNPDGCHPSSSARGTSPVLYSSSYKIQNGSTEVQASSSDPDLDKATTGDSTIIDTSRSSYRFAIPQTFVGKFAEFGSKAGMSLSPGPSKARKRGKGKKLRRKKTYDGRADIRALPDFVDDPIED